MRSRWAVDFLGAFMFTPDAWETSPKSPGGNPIDYSYRTQAVVAVALNAPRRHRAVAGLRLSRRR